MRSKITKEKCSHPRQNGKKKRQQNGIGNEVKYTSAFAYLLMARVLHK